MSREIVEKILDIENEMDLLDKKIQDVYFWERIRNRTLTRIKAEKGLIEENSANSSGNHVMLKRIWLMIKNIFSKNPFSSKEHDIMFAGLSRREKIGKKWHDAYSDPIIDRFELDYVLFEHSHPKDNDHKTPVRTSKILYFDLIRYSAAIPRILGVSKPKLKISERETISKVEEEISNNFDLELDIRSNIVHELHRRKFLLPLYKLLLRVVNPDYLIMVRPGRRTLIEACKEMGVAVIELQHGTISPSHLEYSSPNGKMKNVPDRMFLFGEFWKENCEYSIRDENLHCVGYPFLEDRIEETEQESDDILFISQWAIGKDLTKLAVELSKMIPNKIVYKLHPGEYGNWREKYPELSESNIEVVEDVDLYDLFSKSEVQVGVYSTAIYEGLAFDLNTVLVDLPGIENMNGLMEETGIPKVQTAEELKDELNKERSLTNFDREYFFEPKPYEKLEEIFSQLGVKH